MTPLLHLHNMNAYYGHSHIVRGVDLYLNRGEIVSVLGRNGAGRSTLLKSIMGLVKRTGSVRKVCAQGQCYELIDLAPHQIAHLGVGYVAENRALFNNLTVEQNLILGIKHQPLPQHHHTPHWTLDEMYALFPVLKLRQHHLAAVLSGGEQQLLALCRTLMGNPHIMLIDEPTEGLAPALLLEIKRLLQRLKQRGVSVLLLEQKLSMALDISDRVYVMGKGSMVFEGTPSDFKQALSVQKQWLGVG
jgi:branched-chain amino acid transport system ATP-binding protein